MYSTETIIKTRVLFIERILRFILNDKPEIYLLLIWKKQYDEIVWYQVRCVYVYWCLGIVETPDNIVIDVRGHVASIIS